MLLAGHMSDLWDGGAAIVAAMTDDTVAGGGIRVTTPLDLWVHGLMGVEERIGTCTADAVLVESSATHYEREYGPGVHAAGLAAYTGSLYQSSRSTFRPLMRVSSGVRNLIAGGGGGGGGGDAGAGSAPTASPPPPSAAGDAGTRAASRTLCAGTDAEGAAQAGVMAGVRSEGLTGIYQGDDVTALALEANVAGASVDPTRLRRSTDTAGQVAALQDVMRGDETGTEGEVRSVLRFSELDDTVPDLDDTASVHEASALYIVGDIGSEATVPGMDAAVSHSVDSPRQPPPGVKLGLLGGGGDQVRPASSDFESWKSNYLELYAGYVRQRYCYNWIVAREFEDAISEINGRMIEAYVEFGGSVDSLKWQMRSDAAAVDSYLVLRRLAREAVGAGDINRASEIEEILVSIDRLTTEFFNTLDARIDEFDRAYFETNRIRSLDPRIDAQKVTDWLQEQIGPAQRRWAEVLSGVDSEDRAEAWRQYRFHLDAQRDVKAHQDPRVGSYNRIRYKAEIGLVEHVEADNALQARLLEVMAEPSMHRPAVQGLEAGGATPPPSRTVDSGAAGRLGDIPRVPGPSSSAPAGTDAGDLDRGMLDPPVVGLAGEAHPGTATPRPDDARAMATPEPGAESTFRLRPVDPVPAPGTVRFDAGLQRAGPQPQHSGEAAMGGTAVHSRFVPDPYDMLDPNDLTYTPLWSRGAFNVERALIAGRLPRGFDRSRFVNQWTQIASDIDIEALRESRLPAPRAIDSMIERLRAVDGGRGHIQHIQQLEALKESVDRTLANVYGYRADADWLAKVEEFLKSGSAAQAVGVAQVSVASRGEGIVGGVRTSLQQLRVESAAPPGPTEWGARELSPGAWSPAQDPWGPPWSRDGSDAGELSPGAMSPAQRPLSPWSQDGSSAGELSPRALSPVEDPLSPMPQVRFGEDDVVRFDATQPVSSLGAGDRGIAVGPTAGWQAAETPGFGRLASISAELAFSRREQIVHRLMTGKPLSVAQRSELIGRYERAIRAGMIASPAPRARTAAALLEDLRQLSTAARVSPVTALLSPALDDIDWAAIELMLRLFDAPGL